MRAVGYVTRQSGVNTGGTIRDGKGSFSWNQAVVPGAGSWGDASTLAQTYSRYPDDPVEQIVRYCQDHGHNLVAVFGVDGGAEPLYRSWYELDGYERPSDGSDNPFVAEFSDVQFADLMEALAGARGHPALVVVPDASHLADDLEMLVERLLVIRRTGSETKCSDLDMPDPLQSGEELLGLHGEPDWLGKRIRAVVMEKASRGKVLGRTPYGYRCGADGTLEPVSEEAEVVKQIFQWYVGANSSSGNQDDNDDEGAKGIGMRLIAQRLTDSGVPTRSSRPWSATAVSIILKNRVYVGTYSRYGFMVIGNHEPVVGRSLFRQAQRVLSQKQSKRQDVDSDAPFFLGGLLKCGRCGHGVPGLTRKRRWRRRDDSMTSKTYRYYEFYECSVRRENNSNGAVGIDCPKWRASDLEDKVRATISNWPSRVLTRIAPLEFEVSLEAQLEDEEREFLQALGQVSTGRGDLERLAPHLLKVKRLRNMISERDSTNNSDSSVSKDNDESSDSDHVSRLIADAVDSSDPSRAREALGLLVEDVVVTGASVRVNPRLKI